MNSLQDTLNRRRATQLYRERLILDSPQGAEVVVEGRRLISFCSNDYLGLANDPRVIAALAAGAQRWGVGSGASHLVSGHLRPHHALEEELAAFVGAERALLFSTGYMANLGVAVALGERHGVIYEDRLNHASLIDAARLTRLQVRRFPHADLPRLKALLARETKPLRLMLTDAVFSMDGDIAPLRELLPLTQQHG
ncbi:MAG: aminotransferase class I/II-fold pyridoxal phosphate-dependent enzyme, partial [Pseudomonadota bacterium]